MKIWWFWVIFISQCACCAGRLPTFQRSFAPPFSMLRYINIEHEKKTSSKTSTVKISIYSPHRTDRKHKKTKFKWNGVLGRLLPRTQSPSPNKQRANPHDAPPPLSSKSFLPWETQLQASFASLDIDASEEPSPSPGTSIGPLTSTPQKPADHDGNFSQYFIQYITSPPRTRQLNETSLKDAHNLWPDEISRIKSPSQPTLESASEEPSPSPGTSIGPLTSTPQKPADHDGNSTPSTEEGNGTGDASSNAPNTLEHGAPSTPRSSHHFPGAISRTPSSSNTPTNAPDLIHTPPSKTRLPCETWLKASPSADTSIGPLTSTPIRQRTGFKSQSSDSARALNFNPKSPGSRPESADDEEYLDGHGNLNISHISRIDNASVHNISFSDAAPTTPVASLSKAFDTQGVLVSASPPNNTPSSHMHSPKQPAQTRTNSLNIDSANYDDMNNGPATEGNQPILGGTHAQSEISLAEVASTTSNQAPPISNTTNPLPDTSDSAPRDAANPSINIPLDGDPSSSSPHLNLAPNALIPLNTRHQNPRPRHGHARSSGTREDVQPRGVLQTRAHQPKPNTFPDDTRHAPLSSRLQDIEDHMHRHTKDTVHFFHADTAQSPIHQTFVSAPYGPHPGRTIRFTQTMQRPLSQNVIQKSPAYIVNGALKKAAEGSGYFLKTVRLSSLWHPVHALFHRKKTTLVNSQSKRLSTKNLKGASEPQTILYTFPWIWGGVFAILGFLYCVIYVRTHITSTILNNLLVRLFKKI